MNVKILLTVAVLVVGWSALANAACTKDDRSGCDLSQQVGHAVVDQMEKLGDWTPLQYGPTWIKP